MKSFKQFIKETKEPTVPKEPVLITNTHGSHAKNKQTKEPVLITNTHGSHAKKNPYNIKESEEPQEGSWEHYIKQPHNKGNTREGVSYSEQMDELNKTHPLNHESHDHLRKWTSDSSLLTKHFLDSHRYNKEPESRIWGHDVAGLDTSINSHRLKHNLTTFTGTGFNPEELDSNKVISHLSSSISPHTASGFSIPDTDVNPGKITYHVIKHDLKKGMPAAIIGTHPHHKDDKSISDFETEHEVLLPRTDATEEKYHLHFNGYKDYPNKFGEIVRVHNGEWKPTSKS